MKITENHQRARIVRHNDESVREGNIRNGGKEVVELLDDWNVDVPSWKYPRNLESPRVSSPGFGIDSKMIVMTPQQWSCVMFSDESMFSLLSDSRRSLIWRVPATRYHQENTFELHRYGGEG
ncbi:transposable element Tcb2 transposase [Trichonephila clavipes]|nr:transposable element Tcb2 transposase [Trichonephila clavipes]